MRWLLLWELFWFDPVAPTTIWRDGAEPHLSEFSCRSAQRELYALTKIRGLCVPVHDHRRRFESESSRPGTRIKGRYISLYERG